MPRAALVLLLALGFVPASASMRAQAPTPAASRAAAVTTPQQEWRHGVGDDYFLANYQQLVA